MGRGPILVSTVSGIPIVMDFVRAGMQGAEPRFGKRTDNLGGRMVPLSEWPDLPPDAALIVTAVNHYGAGQALYEAAKEIRELPCSVGSDFDELWAACKQWESVK